MSVLEAARLEDEISHSWAWLGFIVGGIAGAVVGCIAGAALLELAADAAALAVVTSETVVGAVVFGAIALDLVVMAEGTIMGMTAQGAAWGEYIGESIKSVTGKIITGSGNTFVEVVWRGAARAVADFVDCDDDGRRPIAQGSSSVFVNSFHFSRRTEKTSCDAKIEKGCSTVFVGGDTVTLLPIEGEIPAWARQLQKDLGYAGYELCWWSTYLLLGKPGVWLLFEAMPWVSKTLGDLAGRGCRAIGLPEPVARSVEVAAQIIPYILLGKATKSVGEKLFPGEELPGNANDNFNPGNGEPKGLNTVEATTPEGVKISEASNQQKGVFGELKADEYMANEGFEKIGGHGEKPQGIDGVYKNLHPPPEYVIGEAKYGSSGYGTTESGGKQMSDPWVDYNLEKAVGKEQANIIREAGFEKWELRVDKFGNVKVTPITW